MSSETEAPRRTGRGLRIALAVSVALNLLVLGAVGGLVFGARVGPGGPGDAGLAALGFGPVAFALDREDRRALRGRIAEDLEAFRRHGAGFAGGLHEFADALRAEEFDAGAAAAALARQRRHGAGMQEEGHALLLEHLASMPPEARAALADRLERRLRRATR